MCTGLIVVTNAMMVMEMIVPHGPGITHILDPISILLNLQAMLTVNLHKVCVEPNIVRHNILHRRDAWLRFAVC